MTSTCPPRNESASPVRPVREWEIFRNSLENLFSPASGAFQAHSGKIIGFIIEAHLSRRMKSKIRLYRRALAAVERAKRLLDTPSAGLDLTPSRRSRLKTDLTRLSSVLSELLFLLYREVQ